VGAEEIVMVLDILEFVCDDDGAAGLTILEGSRVGAAWRVVSETMHPSQRTLA
jgi:hypothetical protein